VDDGCNNGKGRDQQHEKVKRRIKANVIGKILGHLLGHEFPLCPESTGYGW
jgi:hypothetical protein